MITLQEVVDRNSQFFIRDKGLPGASGDTCVFRAPNGGRCAIGCVLPETIEVEDGPVGEVLFSNETVADFFQGVPFDALEQLADLHDEIARHPFFHVRYKKRLREFAAEWGLSIPDSYLLDDPTQMLLFDDAVPGTQRPLTVIEMKRVYPARPEVVVE